MARIQQPQGMAASRGHTVMDSFKDEVPQALQNSFIAGLKTEFTGLNFPPNSCTDVDNCIFTMLGDVTRREGFDYELNYTTASVYRIDKAINTYRWLNAGGDGETQVVVTQIGNTLYFYESSAATVATPLSTQILSSQVDISGFLPVGQTLDPSTVECQFSDGNGYLFVCHPYCDPFYCTFANGTISAALIDLQVRDFTGFYEASVPVNFRPQVLSVEHKYNLQNQGWSGVPPWTLNANYTMATAYPIPAFTYEAGDPGIVIAQPSGLVTIPAGQITLTVQSGVSGISNGQLTSISVNITTIAIPSCVYPSGFSPTQSATIIGQGTVVSYSGTSLVMDVSGFSTGYIPLISDNPGIGVSQYIIGTENFTITPAAGADLIDTWLGDIGNYPSNTDVWWLYKDSNNNFDPTTTISQITQSISPAPQGHYVMSAFNQNFNQIATLSGLTSIVTKARPRTGTWFQGRVWYAGVDDSQAATGDQQFHTWTENIYFSQIVNQASDFGTCYQTNDPTDENLFDLLPSDGGVITIQGCGSIYKLFPIQNGMLVFAANGIWFITGSQGIGFTANDYTVTKISSIQSITSQSFVEVQGLPVFWNEEGIYTIAPAQQGLGLTVNPLTLGTIRSFYMDIPLDSKKYARGAYNPITYVLQWVYKSTQETDITSRYNFDSALNLNVNTKAFYTYSLEGTPSVNGISYVASPGGSAAPDPTFKYFSSAPTSGGDYNFTFAEERDTNYVDWFSYDNTGVNFTSYFVTGYDLTGQGIRKWQPGYINVFSRNTVNTSYVIQGVWDYSISGNSGQESVRQQINVNKPYHAMVMRRHRIRGHGYVLQLKFTSLNNAPFDIMGWSTFITQNTGP